MKSTIKTKINRFLKFLGLNVVKAKRPRARRITVNKSAETVRVCPPIEDSIRALGKTHYVGDDCPGGHADCDPHVVAGWVAPVPHSVREQAKKKIAQMEVERLPQPNSDNGVKGPTS